MTKGFVNTRMDPWLTSPCRIWVSSTNRRWLQRCSIPSERGCWQRFASRVPRRRSPRRLVRRVRRSTTTCARSKDSAWSAGSRTVRDAGSPNTSWSPLRARYVLSPDVLGDSAVDPGSTDRLSSNYALALASRVVREVSDLTRRAREADKPLATLAIDTDIRFASGADRADFTRDLTSMVTALAARYHDEHAPNGRWHRVVTLAHQRPPTHRRT